MSSVLVTGATGFVGSAVARRLVDDGVPVRITVREKSNTSNIQGLACDMVQADILDQDSLCAAMQGCTQVYHVAGLYRSWMQDYSRLYAVNVQGTRCVLEAALRAGVKKVVHTSSIAALGVRQDGNASDEETPFNLFHMKIPYEMSKYQSEIVALEYVHRGIDVVIVRPALVMGAGDVYPTPSGKMVLDVLKGRMPSYFSGGIDVVDVDDVALGHVLAMERGTSGQSYNLGSVGNFTTLGALFAMIARAGGVRPPALRVPVNLALAWAYVLTFIADHVTHREPVATPANVRVLAMKKRIDFSKAADKLGFPQTPLQEIVTKTVRWYQNEGYVCNE